MRACGVDLKGKEARLAIVADKDGGPIYVPCETKKIALADDKDNLAVQALLQTIKSLAHEHSISVFAIKSRAHGGKMGGGAISFKIETLFQLTGCNTVFINPVALARFARTNAGGLPAGLLKYQNDAFRCAAYQLMKSGANFVS